MSAEALGADLLRELKNEGLNELFFSLQDRETAFKAPLGFPPLDRLLAVFQNPSPTRQQQQYYAQSSTQSHETYQTPSTLKERSRPVIEITGAAPCSGKTQLLHYIISISLLPPKHKEVHICGSGHAVVLLDLSSKFSVQRLYNVMHGHISSIFSTTSSATSGQELSSLISDSLTHLHIFRPQGPSSLLATIDTLPSYLLAQPPTHFSANRQLGLLAISDLSAFLWQDRLDADEESGLSTTGYTGRANNSLFVQRYRSLVSSLRHIQHLFSCAIVATTWGLAPVTSVANHRVLRPQLPSVWNNFCTVRLVVERHRVPKFGPGMSIEEAAKEAAQRWATVERSGFSAWINWWGSEDWREEVREGVRGLGRSRSFTFKVLETGVSVDDRDD